MQARVTVTQQVAHQTPDGQPRAWPAAFYRRLKSSEAAYERTMTLTAEWQPLDRGWIDSCSMMLLDNPAARFSVNPTEQQRAEAEALVVEVAFRTGLGCIVFDALSPGDSHRMRPPELSRVVLRCLGSGCKVHVVLIPE